MSGAEPKRDDWDRALAIVLRWILLDSEMPEESRVEARRFVSWLFTDEATMERLTEDPSVGVPDAEWHWYVERIEHAAHMAANGGRT